MLRSKTETKNDKSERIQKILAMAGIASRRNAEKLISLGEITVNGKIAKLGDKAIYGKDAIKVAGKLLTRVETPIYLALNKPRGVISMLRDPGGRPTLAEYLGKVKSRVFPVGRLDFTTEGLILLTNDGQFNQTVLDNDELVKVFHVKIQGHPTPENLKTLVQERRVNGKIIHIRSVKILQKFSQRTLVRIELAGPSAVDLKLFLARKGFFLEKMTRTSIGDISIEGMKPGEFRYLNANEVQSLLSK
jgi:pseudouridine synthase